MKSSEWAVKVLTCQVVASLGDVSDNFRVQLCKAESKTRIGLISYMMKMTVEECTPVGVSLNVQLVNIVFDISQLFTFRILAKYPEIAEFLVEDLNFLIHVFTTLYFDEEEHQDITNALQVQQGKRSNSY